MKQWLDEQLSQRRAQHLYRSRRELQSAQAPEVTIDGQNFLAFCSNDYLGLANHPQVVEAFVAAAKHYGVGSGASHLVCGHSREHHALEQELAAFTGRDRTLLFSTGFMANLGVINALVGAGDSIFEDKLNHASLLDGGLSSGAKFQRFLHNDVAQLERKLAAAEAQKKLVVVDGVFSMDGDLAPVHELARICDQHRAWLMVDDAHGFGVLGKNGGGVAEHFNLNQDQLPVLMGTLGKSFGTFGAFIAGSDALIETLIQLARTYIYTTALPPAVAAASRVSLQLLQTEHWRREKLRALIQRFRAGVEQLGLPLMASSTPIQPIMVGDAETALAWSSQLAAQGILVTAIRPPTVAAGSARLRVTLSAAHTEAQVDRLLDALSQLVRKTDCAE
ncbi:8-amino-7-oxononanoate synthase [Simiduia curdlanivorans]|uniref:8-amino-7-oxononanoate synthase n=1 Tax=Simiduia curdlanivorans TaxID=1492769 RepID=A0ABV8V109_9GAMM|nr:8-amino-7-oxononanoate synthase [Simiduia curdlanivorans]MDN3637624.1 8-amino-7-oxononanoate synthase [Simiduia curdlanivorans]